MEEKRADWCGRSSLSNVILYENVDEILDWVGPKRGETPWCVLFADTTKLQKKSEGPSQKFAEAQWHEQNSLGERVGGGGGARKNYILGFKWSFVYTLAWEMKI